MLLLVRLPVARRACPRPRRQVDPGRRHQGRQAGRLYPRPCSGQGRSIKHAAAHRVRCGLPDRIGPAGAGRRAGRCRCGPSSLTHAGDATNRVFVATEQGVIHVFSPTTRRRKGQHLPRHPESGAQRTTCNEEEGFLGLAFHPDFQEDRRVLDSYIGYVARPAKRRLEGSALAGDDPALKIPIPRKSYCGSSIASRTTKRRQRSYLGRTVICTLPSATAGATPTTRTINGQNLNIPVRQGSPHRR